MLRAVDGKRNVAEVIRAAEAVGSDGLSALNKVRRLARRGVFDLVPAN